MKAERVEFDGFEPYMAPIDQDGRRWLYAHINAREVQDVYAEVANFPKYVRYDGLLYKWSSWNSDDYYVCYKECLVPTMAIPA